MVSGMVHGTVWCILWHGVLYGMVYCMALAIVYCSVWLTVGICVNLFVCEFVCLKIKIHTTPLCCCVRPEIAQAIIINKYTLFIILKKRYPALLTLLCTTTIQDL